MTDAAAFSAVYADWKLIKTRGVIQIVLEADLRNENLVYKVLGGMPNPAAEVWVGVAPLDRKVGFDQGAAPSRGSLENTQGADSTLTVTPNEKLAVELKPPRALPQRVGRICSDIRFIRWLSEYRGIEMNKDAVADFVRLYCGVNSRGEILPDTNAETKWNLLESAYLAENQ